MWISFERRISLYILHLVIIKFNELLSTSLSRLLDVTFNQYYDDTTSLSEISNSDEFYDRSVKVLQK